MRVTLNDFELEHLDSYIRRMGFQILVSVGSVPALASSLGVIGAGAPMTFSSETMHIDDVLHEQIVRCYSVAFSPVIDGLGRVHLVMFRPLSYAYNV